MAAVAPLQAQGFNNYLQVGEHSLLIDTAISFGMGPVGAEVDHHEVIVKCKTKGNDTFEYQILLDTLEKTKAVVKQLVDQNVKWMMCFNDAQCSLADRTVKLRCLGYDDPLGTFADALGLTSPHDYTVETVQDAFNTTLKFTFLGDSDPTEKMQAVLQKIDRLCGAGSLAQLLKDDPTFKLPDVYEADHTAEDIFRFALRVAYPIFHVKEGTPITCASSVDRKPLSYSLDDVPKLVAGTKVYRYEAPLPPALV